VAGSVLATRQRSVAGYEGPDLGERAPTMLKPEPAPLRRLDPG
jgi:hypothetical protein